MDNENEKIDDGKDKDKKGKNKDDKPKVELKSVPGGLTIDGFISNYREPKSLGNAGEAGFRAWCKRKKIPYRQSESEWKALWKKFTESKPD